MKVAVLNLNKRKYISYIVIITCLAIVILTYAIPKTIGSIYISPKILEYVSPYLKQRNELFKPTEMLKATPFLSSKSYVKDATEENNENYSLGEYSGENNIEFNDKNSSGDYNKISGNRQLIKIGDIEINNQSDRFDLDFQGFINRSYNLSKSEKILIYNTHTSESYTSSAMYPFSHTDTYRIQDSKFNMSRIGQELYNLMVKDNYNVVFDSTPHDYNDYNNSYKNSRNTINKNRDKYGEFGLMLDLHRDAIADLTYRPVTVIENKTVAKMMIVVGIGTAKNSSPYYENSLALALEIQQKANEMYPGLFRPMLVRSSKYNQDINKNSLLIEVGATGNMLEESLGSIYYLEKILNEIYK